MPFPGNGFWVLITLGEFCERMFFNHEADEDRPPKFNERPSKGMEVHFTILQSSRDED
jgi:hypothetical protein